MTLYQLLTGKSPNEAPYELLPVRSIDKGLSVKIEKIICRCTRQNPAERYQSVAELVNDLEPVKDSGSGEEAGQLSSGSFPTGNSNAGPGSSKKPSESFKKVILTVWDNAEFGCEFAYMAARLSGYSVLLADLDLLSPKADLFLNIRKYSGRVAGSNFFGNSGLNIVMESIDKNYLTAELLTEASLKRRELDNLFVLTGNYKLENYEYYSDESVLKLIDKAYRTFDITVLLVNRSIYDSFTVLSLSRSDVNIVAVRADIDRLREFNSNIAFLKEKQQIPMEKYKFVAFEYQKSVSLSPGEMREATSGNLIGFIAFSRKRAVYRNLKSSYAARMEREIIREYSSILEYFNILSALSLMQRFGFWIGRLPDAFKAAAGKH